ncbi:MAG: GNAT family N-acetyltransferase [Planctomycetota bacterium]
MLKTDYWHDPKARAAFKEFMLLIHGLDFTEWESLGYWDEAYTPFSYFAGDTVVASACIYLLDAVIKGEAARLAQVSGVGTLPEWRRRGLSRQLAELGLDWAPDGLDGVFLFATDDATPFYGRCGFKPIVEYVETVAVTPVPRRDGVIKLDPGRQHDCDKIYRYAARRTPISAEFSVLNDRLIMFHVLHGLRDHVYEIPDLACLVFYERANGCLSIFDIVGESVPRLWELYPYLADQSDRHIELHFSADRLGIDKVEPRPLLGNNPFVRGTFPIARPVFPFTSRA